MRMTEKIKIFYVSFKVILSKQMDTEYNPPIDISHTQTEKPFRIKHTIKKPNFFVIDKISYDYIANHNKKILFGTYSM